MSVIDVPVARLERVSAFISWLGGGDLADALMSLVVGYEQRGIKIAHLKDKLARLLEQEQETP